MSGDLLVVLGPRTRLAAAALASPWARAQEILLIARDHGEHEVLAAAHPAISIVAASDPGPLVPPGHRSVRIMCCAVGLIHPVRPDPAVHMDAAARDLRVLDRILGAAVRPPCTCSRGR